MASLSQALQAAAGALQQISDTTAGERGRRAAVVALVLRAVEHAPGGGFLRRRAEAAVAAMEGRNAVLLKWHGAIVVGPTLHWTCLGAVLLEYNARLLFQARLMGDAEFFPRQHSLEMFAAYEGHEGTQAYHREWDYWVERVRRAQGGELFGLYGNYDPVSPRVLRPD